MRSIVVAVIVAVALTTAGCSSGTPTATHSAPVVTSAPEPAPVAPEPASPVTYKVVEEKEFSYANCRRVAYKIKVADGSSPESVDAAQQQIIDENRSSWDDITVWTYNESDTDDYVKNSAFTVDMAEYSTCQ